MHQPATCALSKLGLRRQHALIGKILERENPELYERLKFRYVENPGLENDLGKIALFYSKYLMVSEPPKGNYAALHQRRIFVAAIYQIYCPQVYYQSPRYRIPRKGIFKELSTTMELKAYKLSYLMGQAISWYKLDGVFRRQVDDAVATLIKPTADAVPRENFATNATIGGIATT